MKSTLKETFKMSKRTVDDTSNKENDPKEKKQRKSLNVQEPKKAHELLKIANQLYDEKKCTDALRLYNEVIEKDSSNENYYIHRAACHMLLGNFQLALDDCDKAVSLNNSCIKAYLVQGKLYHVLGFPEEAMSSLNRVKSLQPENPALSKAIKAIENLQQVIQEAERIFKKREFKEALKKIDEVLLRAPQSEKFRKLKEKCELCIKRRLEELKKTADKFMAKEMFSKALGPYHELIELEPECTENYLNRGLCYYKQKQHTKSLEDFRKVLEIDRTSVQAYVWEAKVLLAMGDLASASLSIQLAEELDSDEDSDLDEVREKIKDLQALISTAEKEFENKNFEKVLKCVEKASKQSFTHEQLKSLKEQSLKLLAERKKEYGNILYKEQKYREALAQYNRALDIYPTSVYYTNRAACLMMLNNYSSAIKDCEKAMNMDKDNVKAFARAAKCHLVLGNNTFAETLLKECERFENGGSKEVQSVKAFHSLINEIDIAYLSKDYAKTVTCIDEALTQLNGCVKFYVIKAECLAHLYRLNEAEKVYSHALIMEPGSLNALFVKGLCNYYNENLDVASNVFKYIYRSKPGMNKALEYIEKIHKYQTQIQLADRTQLLHKYQAHAMYTETMKVDHANRYMNARLYFKRSCCYDLPTYSNAIEDCTKAIQLNPSFFLAYMQRARLYMELRVFDKAIEDYEYVYKKNPTPANLTFLRSAKAAYERSQIQNYYSILGLSFSATDDEIKKAYRVRALKHHPDRHAGVSEEEMKKHEENFKKLQEAYEVLSDSNKRAIYNMSLYT